MCTLCRQALTSGGNTGLIHGFYWSILLLVGVPLIIMTVAAAIAWRHHRRRLRPDTVGGAHDA